MKILIGIIAVIIFIVIVINLKKSIEKNKRGEAERAQKEEEDRKIKAEEEKKRLEDLKHDRIINCPKCNGNGEFILVHQIQWMGDDRVYNTRSIHDKPDAWELDGKTEGDGKSWQTKYKREDCFFCGGKGIAYAYFEKQNRKCTQCNGEGVLISKTKIKKDIGNEEQTKKTKCEKCNGTGNNEIGIVHVKTLKKGLIGGYYSDDDEDIKYQLENSDKFDILLSENEFYSSSKPRFK